MLVAPTSVSSSPVASFVTSDTPNLEYIGNEGSVAPGESVIIQYQDKYLGKIEINGKKIHNTQNFVVNHGLISTPFNANYNVFVHQTSETEVEYTF